MDRLTRKRLDPEAMITQVFAAADAKTAFDLIESEPQRTLKVQLNFCCSEYQCEKSSVALLRGI
ncbi:MAG: hypothetical protein EOS34_28015 [Mesorhizobium sp.]|nr:MAG: hypothetical protein EOS34_28015 [Mesorhizobium sp.]